MARTISKAEFSDRKSRLETLLRETQETSSTTGTGRPFETVGFTQKTVLAAHVDVLEKLYGLIKHPKSASQPRMTERERTADIKHTFNYIVPVLVRDYGDKDPYAGVKLLEQLTEKLDAGENIWAACIAIAPDPVKAFKLLLEEFDGNKNFAEWIASSNKTEGHQTADYDLWQSTLGDERWTQEDLDKWHVIFSMPAKWDTIAMPDAEKFTLSKEGMALGSEVEVRNRDASYNVNEEGQRWEIKSPHTTNHQAFAEYLQNLKQYFIDCEDMFTKGYYWDLHLNISVTEKERKNTIQHGKVLNEIAHKIMMPANPFFRNIHKSYGFDFTRADGPSTPTQNFQVKQSEPLRENLPAENSTIDKRCLDRMDYGRIEMKCCSLWAGSDVEYIMDYAHIMQILADHPERIEPLKNSINALYEKYNLITPEAFERLNKTLQYTDRLLHRTELKEIPEAEKYEHDSVLFRAEMKEIFKKIFAEVDAPPPPVPHETSSFKNRIIVGDAYRGRGH